MIIKEENILSLDSASQQIIQIQDKNKELVVNQDQQQESSDQDEQNRINQQEQKQQDKEEQNQQQDQKQETIQTEVQKPSKQQRKRRNKNSAFQVVLESQKEFSDNKLKVSNEQEIISEQNQKQVLKQETIDQSQKQEQIQEQQKVKTIGDGFLEMIYINHIVESYSNNSSNSVLEENVLLQKLDGYTPGKLIHKFKAIADKAQYIKIHQVSSIYYIFNYNINRMSRFMVFFQKLIFIFMMSCFIAQQTDEIQVALTFSLITTLITIIPQTFLTWSLNKQSKAFQIFGIIIYVVTTLLAVYIILTYTVKMKEDQLMNWSISLITTIIFDITFIQQALDILYVNLFQYSVKNNVKALQNILLIIKPELLYLFQPNILTIDLDSILGNEEQSSEQFKDRKKSDYDLNDIQLFQSV